MSLFFVNCERTVLFSVKRDLDPPFTTLCYWSQARLTRILAKFLFCMLTDYDEVDKVLSRHSCPSLRTQTDFHLLFLIYCPAAELSLNEKPEIRRCSEATAVHHASA